jgi:hypothetical protein
MQGSRNLDDEQRSIIEQAKAERIHEHEQMWGPEEFFNLIESNQFKIEGMGGTPLFASVFYQDGYHHPATSNYFCQFAQSESYTTLLHALREDLIEAGRIAPHHHDWPVKYVIGDDLILLAKKEG